MKRQSTKRFLPKLEYSLAYYDLVILTLFLNYLHQHYWGPRSASST